MYSAKLAHLVAGLSRYFAGLIVQLLWAWQSITSAPIPVPVVPLVASSCPHSASFHIVRGRVISLSSCYIVQLRVPAQEPSQPFSDHRRKHLAETAVTTFGLCVYICTHVYTM